ncbi:VanZ family protein [Flavobacterium pedocola]
MAPKKNFLLAFFWTLAIAVACLISTSDVPNVAVTGFDKIVHLLFYMVFTVLWFLYLKKRFADWSFFVTAIVIVVATLLYGTIIELLQDAFTETRKADVLDVLANVAGSLVGVVVMAMVKMYDRNSKSVQ